MKTVMFGSIVVLTTLLIVGTVIYINKVADLRTMYFNQLIAKHNLTMERDKLWCQFVGSNDKNCKRKGD